MRTEDRVKLLDAISDLCKEAGRLAVQEAQTCRSCSMADESEFSNAQDALLEVMTEIGL